MFFFISYILPAFGISLSYCRLSSLISRQGDSPSNTSHKQTMARLLLTVQILFLLCWLPYHLYFLYTYWSPSIIYYTHSQTIFLACYWLAMANSAINPIIYLTISAK